MKEITCFLIIILISFFSIQIVIFSEEFSDEKKCRKVFGQKEGIEIYKAYKKIAELKYLSEEEELDYWQKPFETKKLQTGDCEDAVIFYASLLPSTIDGELVWGFVIHNDGWTYKINAHAWYQLKDVNGNVYVVEGFEGEKLCGIIPINILSRTEERQVILKISQLEFTELRKEKNFCEFQVRAETKSQIDVVMLGSGIDNISQFADITSRMQNEPMYIPRAMYRYFPESWGMSDAEKGMRRDKEIHKIYKKLYEMFNRR